MWYVHPQVYFLVVDDMIKHDVTNKNQIAKVPPSAFLVLTYKFGQPSEIYSQRWFENDRKRIQKSRLFKPELNTTAGIFTLSIGPIHSKLNNTSFQAVMGVGGKDGRIRYTESKKAVVIVESITQKGYSANPR